MKSDATTLIGCTYILAILVQVAFWIAVAGVAIHFIAKLW